MVIISAMHVSGTEELNVVMVSALGSTSLASALLKYFSNQSRFWKVYWYTLFKSFLRSSFYLLMYLIVKMAW